MSEVQGVEVAGVSPVGTETLQVLGGTSIGFHPVVETVGGVEAKTLGGDPSGQSDNDSWDTYYAGKPKVNGNHFTGLSPLS